MPFIPLETPRKATDPAFPRVSADTQTARDADAEDLVRQEFSQRMPAASRSALETEYRQRFNKEPPKVRRGFRVQKAKLHRTFVVTVHSIWVESPYKGDTTINYGLTVSILNDAAVEIARKNYEGIAQSSQWGSWGATETFGTLMSSALADPEIAKALLN